jgi:hypothetical protein
MSVKPTPLQILLTEYLPPAEAAALEAQVAKIIDPPQVIALCDLKLPEYGNDPDELLKHRFLYRGAVCLLLGPTGVGKSALLMQAAMCWAVGKPFFGIVPGEIYQKKGMRILLVQAENDQGDLAEMRDGVKAGCDELTAEEKELATHRIMVRTLSDKSSEAFAEELDALLTEEGPFDLVMVDPAFAYLGGDSKSQKDVSHFMRDLLNPLIQRHKVGLLLAHHTNKPLRGKEKEGWEAGDFAYLGAGSAEWINPSRAALAIRSLGSEDVFELRAAKRGKRLRWTDAEGRSTNAQYIAHHGAPGVICWRQATPEEVAEVAGGSGGIEGEVWSGKMGRPKVQNEHELLHAVLANPGVNFSTLSKAVQAVMGVSYGTVVNMVKACVEMGWLRQGGDRQFRRYAITSEGQSVVKNNPSTWSWNEACQKDVKNTF